MIDNFLDEVHSIESSELHLYFITRSLKENVKKKSKVLDKFDFKVYQVDIKDDIREHLLSLTIDQLEHAKKKKLETAEYEVITDDIDTLFTYQMQNKAIAFASVVNDQLPNKSTIPKVQDLEEIVGNEDLWAYCIGFNTNDDKWIYTFRKITAGKVAIDEQENKKSKSFGYIRTMFNTTSNKLELVKGQTVNLDKQIDCIYLEDTFYILQKTLFEQIIGLTEEYKLQAAQVVLDLEATEMLEGINVLKEFVEKNPSVHKKLVRLQKLDNFKNLDSNTLDKMITVASQFGNKVKKSEEGKLLIEDEKDIDMAIKLLCDYYKEGKVFGKFYGTFAGKAVSPILT